LGVFGRTTTLLGWKKNDLARMKRKTKTRTLVFLNNRISLQGVEPHHARMDVVIHLDRQSSEISPYMRYSQLQYLDAARGLCAPTPTCALNVSTKTIEPPGLQSPQQMGREAELLSGEVRCGEHQSGGLEVQGGARCSADFFLVDISAAVSGWEGVGGVTWQWIIQVPGLSVIMSMSAVPPGKTLIWSTVEPE